MPSEIILPDGTEFVSTASIPSLIAEAIKPKPSNERRFGEQPNSATDEIKTEAFNRYKVEREHRAMMCCAIDDGKLQALSRRSRRRVDTNELDSIVMVSELAKYVGQFEIDVRVEQTALAGKVKTVAGTSPNGDGVWWQKDYDILLFAQNAGDSLRRRKMRTSNRNIGNAIALRIEDEEKRGSKRKAPDGLTIKNTILKGWKYTAE